MWLGFLLQKVGFWEGCSGAIIPLNPEGLKGIFLSPFLHGNLEHIFGNSVPIFVLVFLLFQFYPFIAKKVFFLVGLSQDFWFGCYHLLIFLPEIIIRSVLLVQVELFMFWHFFCFSAEFSGGI